MRRSVPLLALVALLMSMFAGTADAHRRGHGKKNSTIRITNISDAEVSGTVHSGRGSCERGRLVTVTVDGNFQDSTTTDDTGNWSVAAAVDDGDNVLATVSRAKRRKVKCASDSDRRTADLDGGATSHTLTVSTTSGGEVNSSPAGISDCRSTSGDCVQNYPHGQQVTLVATPDGGQQFAGWGGACAGAGTGQCTVTMTSDRFATATFNNTGVPPEPQCSIPEDVPEPIRGLLCTVLGLLGV